MSYRDSDRPYPDRESSGIIDGYTGGHTEHRSVHTAELPLTDDSRPRRAQRPAATGSTLSRART
jgi:hypothetical protein